MCLYFSICLRDVHRDKFTFALRIQIQRSTLKCTCLLICKYSDTLAKQLRKTASNIGIFLFLYVFLTVHICTTLVNDQLDAQFLYFIIRLLQSSTCFEQRRAHHQEVKLY